MVPIGMPRSVGLLGDVAHRDRQIEQTCDQILLAARAGISTIKYNMYVLDVLRTGTTPERGGARYSTWEYERTFSKKSLTITHICGQDTCRQIDISAGDLA